MPQRDTFHDAVRRALVNDGWTITHDPLLLAFGSTNVYVDLGADLPLGAEKEGRRIAVEVKSFLGPSEVTELERLLGQFVLYRSLMRIQEPGRTLYVAVPQAIFDTFIGMPNTLAVLRGEQVRLLVFNPDEEFISTWID